MIDAADLTKNQKLVMDALQGTEEPLGAYALLDRLREHGLRSPLQIYRALDKLVEFGVVHKLESINAFVACAHPHERHEHGLIAFAICDTCGQVDEFSDSIVQKRLASWSSDRGFHAEKTTIELRGRCAVCLAA